MPGQDAELSELNEPYDFDEVARFIGVREDPPAETAGRRHITFLDVLSWATDAGTTQAFYRRALEDGHHEAWMSRRGPLRPESHWALLRADFLRALERLKGPLVGGRAGMRLRNRKEVEQLWGAAIVALRACGFRPGEIALLKETTQSAVSERILGKVIAHKEIGPAKVEGFVCAAGLIFPVVTRETVPVRDGGLVKRTTDLMNNEP